MTFQNEFIRRESLTTTRNREVSVHWKRWCTVAIDSKKRPLKERFPFTSWEELHEERWSPWMTWLGTQMERQTITFQRTGVWEPYSQAHMSSREAETGRMQILTAYHTFSSTIFLWGGGDWATRKGRSLICGRRRQCMWNLTNSCLGCVFYRIQTFNSVANSLYFCTQLCLFSHQTSWELFRCW